MVSLCHVYLSPMPENLTVGPVFPPLRETEIESTVSAELKARRYWVWKLLERAVKSSFGLDFRTLTFQKNPFGKWECDKLHFSLSHTEGMVAVAVSDAPVGLDVENVRAFREQFRGRIPAFLQKIAADPAVPATPEAALRLWTAKESIFKLHGTGKFVPAEVNVKETDTEHHSLPLPEPVFLSLCGERAAYARYFLLENETLTEY